MQEWYLGWEKVSCLESCPQFNRGIPLFTLVCPQLCQNFFSQHTGKGIDLRRRKIWGYYGNNRANLEVCSLTPSDLTVYPEFDWLIGNHSDELTPWIPLMAARCAFSHLVLSFILWVESV